MRGAYKIVSIPWYECQVDGVFARPISAARPGMAWRWSGRRGLHENTPQVGCLAVGLAAEPVHLGLVQLSDGDRVYRADIVQTDGLVGPTLVFLGAWPDSGIELELLDLSLDVPNQEHVICFASGTLIDTDQGDRLVEMVRPGDRLWTLDDGYREVLWTGRRRISGATLATVPALRPVELAPGVLVSPGHRVLAGRDGDTLMPAAAHGARPGVLVPKGVVYVHLLLERHAILKTDSVLSESFHPGSMPLKTLGAKDRARLLHLFPDLAKAPGAYGPTARPLLPTAH